MENKNIKPKRCDKGCLYCNRIAEKINQQRYQLEIKKKDEQIVKIENENPNIPNFEIGIINKDCIKYIQSKHQKKCNYNIKKLQEMETVSYMQ